MYAPRPCRGCETPEIGRLYAASDTGKVRVIESVEQVHPEPQMIALPEGKYFRYGGVQVPQSRAFDYTLAERARTRRRTGYIADRHQSERCTIQVLQACVQDGVLNIQQVGALDAGLADSERQARTRREDTERLPSPVQRIEPNSPSTNPAPESGRRNRLRSCATRLQIGRAHV